MHLVKVTQGIVVYYASSGISWNFAKTSPLESKDFQFQATKIVIFLCTSQSTGILYVMCLASLQLVEDSP